MKISWHIVVASGNCISKLITVAAQFISIRILIDLLGAEQYAVMALLLALPGWFLLCDFGVGASLQNYISECKVDNINFDDKIVAACISLVSILIILVGLIFLLSGFLGEFYLKPAVDLPSSQKTVLFFLSSIFGVLGGIGSVSYKILYALHKGYWANTLPAIMSLLSLITLTLIPPLIESNELLICIIIWLLPNGIAPFALFIFFGFKRFSRFPLAIVYFELWDRAKDFFLLAVFSTITLQVDYVILSQLLSGTDIVIYNIVSKIFILVIFCYTAVLSALWPVLTELLRLNKWDKVRNYIWRYIICGFAFVCIATAFIILVRGYVVNLLAPGSDIILPIGTLIFFGIYQLVRVWTDTYSVVLKSINKIKPFLVLVPVQALFSILFQIYGANNYGINGLVAGLIMSFIVTVFWGLPFAVNKQIKSNI
ncbi:MATE family efflux transporter [Endozoicomonas ascidiicola]|uniref:MATE family efflux transporter n=1 Tax=Endozoicomonas ascidiicola TaxID=1698521 RepID=UPI0008348D18|nr:MATE family efflux transporter [Endozoicomonas ascidiicola]